MLMAISFKNDYYLGPAVTYTPVTVTLAHEEDTTFKL